MKLYLAVVTFIILQSNIKVLPRSNIKLNFDDLATFNYINYDMFRPKMIYRGTSHSANKHVMFYENVISFFGKNEFNWILTKVIVQIVTYGALYRKYIICIKLLHIV